MAGFSCNDSMGFKSGKNVGEFNRSKYQCKLTTCPTQQLNMYAPKFLKNKNKDKKAWLQWSKVSNQETYFWFNSN